MLFFVYLLISVKALTITLNNTSEDFHLESALNSIFNSTDQDNVINIDASLVIIKEHFIIKNISFM